MVKKIHPVMMMVYYINNNYDDDGILQKYCFRGTATNQRVNGIFKI